MSTIKLKKQIIILLLCIMPYHYFFFTIILSKFGALTLYRDILILLVLLLHIKNRGKIKVKTRDTAFIFSAIVLCFAALTSDVFPASLSILRVYIMPIVLLLCCKDTEFNEHDREKIIKVCIVNSMIICAYGIFQAWFLGADYLVRLGYPTNWHGDSLSASLYLSSYAGAAIGRGIQRVISTFSAANMCCFYLSTVLIYLYYQNNQIRMSNFKKKVIFYVLILTIVLTFSRSCWLGLIVLVCYDFLKKRKIKKRIISLGIASFFLLILFLLFGGDNRFISGIQHVIISSFSGSDTSVNKHTETIILAIDTIKNNLLGLGFGKNGPRATVYGYNNLVESSYLLMCFEVGVLGAIVYFSPYFRILRSKYSLVSKKMIVFLLVVFLNIPYIQEYECMAIFAILLGVTMSRNNNILTKSNG